MNKLTLEEAVEQLCIKVRNEENGFVADGLYKMEKAKIIKEYNIDEDTFYTKYREAKRKRFASYVEQQEARYKDK